MKAFTSITCYFDKNYKISLDSKFKYKLKYVNY